MNANYVITDFLPEHQPGIDRLLSGIQDEFAETIYGPQTLKMKDAAALPARKYWVVTHHNKVVGAIGVVILQDCNACLKSMLLQKEYRGSDTGIANNLLLTAITYTKLFLTRQLFLGTMLQFKAAQAFYLKHGFTQIPETSLPLDFSKNPVDKVFFRLLL